MQHAAWQPCLRGHPEALDDQATRALVDQLTWTTGQEAALSKLIESLREAPYQRFAIRSWTGPGDTTPTRVTRVENPDGGTVSSEI